MGDFLHVVAIARQAQDAPARGTAVGEVVAATIVAFVAVIAVVALGLLHRRRQVLAPLVRQVEDRTGFPAWSIIPTAIAGLSLLCAVWGYLWDVSWHIDRGRDPGAFANPAHWFIIVGLDGIVFAGILSLILGDERPNPSAVQLRPGWRVPVGGILLTICGLVALAGFPFDDIWHRLFGQDVTAWGPTHIQMIGGASLSTLAIWVLSVEGQRCADPGVIERHRWITWVRDVVSGGAFLIGLSTLQVEFDFGVPQFRAVYHPIMLMLAASIALVAVRIRAGRGAALGAAVVFIAIWGGISFLITPVFGRSTMHFPLYLAEALIVEAVALVIPRSRQITLGLLAGLGIGTLGLAAEWLWSHLWMPLPWRASLLPEAAVLGLAAALGGGVVGGLVGRSLAPDDLARQRTPRGLASLAGILVLLCLAVPLPMTEHTEWTASITLDEDRGGGPDAQAFVTVQLGPADAADEAEWFYAIAWQGSVHSDGGLVLADMQRLGDGVYRTERPMPIGGTWKTAIRIHRGASIQLTPIFAPADPAIPAEEIPAETDVVRPFVRDKSFLQREAITDRVELERGSYALLALLAMLWLGSLSWGLARLERATPQLDAVRVATRREVRRESPPERAPTSLGR